GGSRETNREGLCYLISTLFGVLCVSFLLFLPSFHFHHFKYFFTFPKSPHSSSIWVNRRRPRPMDTNNQAQSSPYPPPQAPVPAPPFHHLLQQQQQQLQMFWSFQRQEIEQVNDFKNHQLPLARIKKIMKADEDVRMISAEAPILFAKACELFILELTIRSWLHAEENKRRTLQKNDIAAAITRTDIFDFLVDIVPRDEIKDEAGLGGMVGATASGVPYYYPPMGQPAGAPGGMMIGRPAMDPTGVYAQPPSQAWQSVWQTAAEDGSYASGASSGQGNLDGQR
uniref:Core Histone H2A/H2B/H3 domain-containing protein n=2 Tax=Cucumis melo TaxID=3656 RepID=A0A9I9DZV5_CUCME